MPGIIAALAESGTPFSILTKGTLLRRDLAAAGRRGAARAGRPRRLDGHLGRRPARRARARRPDARGRGWTGRGRCTDAGLPCGVFLAPVLPGLTDTARAPGRRARRDRRGRRDRRDRHPAAPAARGPRVVHRVAGARAPGARRRATGSSTPAAPTCRTSTAAGCRSAWRRSWPGTGWTGKGRRRARVAAPPLVSPATRRSASPPAACPPAGMPGVRPKGERPPSPQVNTLIRCHPSCRAPPLGRLRRPGPAHRAPSVIRPAARTARRTWAARTTPRATGGAPPASESRRYES